MLTPTPILSLRNIRHSYGRRIVLRLDQLDVCQGELLALVGPSGAGKSTLLRLLNYLEAPTQGQVMYHDQVYTPNTLPLAIRRRITTVFQQPYLLNTSVYHNVTYGLRLRGNRNGQAIVEEVLRTVGLANLRNAPAHTLSGGESQRVSLARGLVLNPEILLLDEPTANLDPANVRLLENIIMQANRQRHTTIVLVTHNIWQARRLAQRVAFLFDGELLEVTPTEQFFESPRHPKSAAFIRGELVY
ncbi:MAG: phosphate ABC transporter ATP-binding protein [Chloroflexi bacterium]|nr:phosphate ABC transporter ATP-binding protein [Chloroflexota bacterium]